MPLFAAFGLSEPALVDLTVEDGGVEYASAFAWLLATGLCAQTLWHQLRRPAARQARWLLVGWMALCFLCMGEEVSWGQRLIGFETPDPIFSQNRQQEVTLHNLPLFAPEGQSWRDALATGELNPALLLNINKLFVLGMLGYFVGLPVLARRPRIARLLGRFGYRDMSWAFPAVLSLGLVASYAVVIGTSLQFTHAVSELRELFLALFALTYVAVLTRQSTALAASRVPALGDRR
ncbi:MAG: hypothetical protein AAF657_08125 [Acidobacteriota bacterium]